VIILFSPVPNFFIKKVQIKDHHIEIRGELLRHLRDSLRVQRGERIFCVDEDASRYTVVVTHVGKDLLTGDVTEEVKRGKGPAVYIHIAQAVPKGPRLDFIIEKATELGVSAITPVITERSVVRIEKERVGERLKRWRRIALESAQQSGRWDVPEIAPPVTLPEFLASFRKTDLNLLLWEGEKRVTLRGVLKGAQGVKSVTVLIGPEGGFSEDEVGKAVEKGFVAVSLGELILRTETAPIAALSILQYEFGGVET